MSSPYRGFALYQFTHFSALERHFESDHRKLSALLIFFGVLLFFSRISGTYFVEAASLFIVFVLGLTYFVTKTMLFR